MMQPTLRFLLASSTFPSIPDTDDNLLWAALDLGSNSFHLLLVRRTRSGFVVQERLKEKVQLLAGFEAGHITESAQARGLACLARFAQRLKPVERAHIRALGTYALREAANASDFLQLAQKVLQAPVDVISGDYEARLIYRGVAHHLGVDAGRRLVIDIGGGSTEFALGDAESAVGTLSVGMGCVAFRDHFFAPGVMQAEGYAVAKQQAVAMLRQQLAGSDLGQTLQTWPEFVVLGTSGTVASIETVGVGHCQRPLGH